MKKKQRHLHLFETREFFNQTEAELFREEYELKMPKRKKGLILSIIATICSLIAVIFIISGAEIGVILGDGACILAIISYCLGGGVKHAVKWAWKICIFVYWAVPFLLIDIVAAIAAFAGVVCVFFFAPVIFIWINLKQLERDYESASAFCNYEETENKIVDIE